jgi:hypothetical protein
LDHVGGHTRALEDVARRLEDGAELACLRIIDTERLLPASSLG